MMIQVHFIHAWHNVGAQKATRDDKLETKTVHKQSFSCDTDNLEFQLSDFKF